MAERILATYRNLLLNRIAEGRDEKAYAAPYIQITADHGPYRVLSLKLPHELAHRLLPYWGKRIRLTLSAEEPADDRDTVPRPSEP